MLSAFTAGLTLITINELGDKTFFIAMCLAMRHRRRFVFAGAVAALSLMTVLSVMLGQLIGLLPKPIIHYGSILLFIGFGLKLLYDAYKMSPECGSQSLAAEDRLLDCASDAEREAVAAIAQAEANLKRKTPFAICLESFVLVFMGELGDRTQIATITLAATNNALGITLGSIAGHWICTAIAVMGGRLIAGHISERMVATIGGVLFLVFAGISGLEG